MAGPGSAGPEVYDSSSEPLTPQKGDFWYDGSVLRLRRGAGWLTIGGDVNALSNNISVVSAAVVSVEAHAVAASAAATSVDTRVNTVSQQVSVLSQAASVLSAGLGTVQLKVASNAQIISGTTTTKISGLSASVASAAIYQIEGNVLFNMSVVDTTLFNISGPATTSVRLKWQIGKDQSSQVVQHVQAFGDNASATISTVSAYTAKLDGVIVTGAAAGTVQLFAFASAAGADINIKKGSYLRAYKIG